MPTTALLSSSTVEPCVRQPCPSRARVLHVINGQHYSGAERVQDLLAQRLPTWGYEVGFACVKPDRFPALRQATACALERLPMTGRFDTSAARRLARLVRAEGYRILHAHTPRSLLVARLASLWTGVPLVYHVHSPASRDSTRGLANRVNALVERLCLAGGARLIAVSESLARHMRAAGFRADRITVVPNGVPVQPARPGVGRSTGEWTLGTVALFRPRKGLEVLLEALAELRRAGLPVRLRAVGGFETEAYRAKLQRHVDELGLAGAIDWTGFTRDVAAELTRMDLFVLPSLFGEGLPMVVLEAMACGLPVVATRVEGVPEAIREGCDGLLVQPGDASDLAHVVAELVREPSAWQALSRNARARQRARFSDESMAAGVAAVYDRLL